MIKSMTGFGHVTVDVGQLKISAEVKSLNSKFLDLNLRLPKTLSDKELELRNLVSEKLERGKVTLAVEVERANTIEVKQTYNEALFTAYYTGLKKLADKVVAPYEGLFELALNAPDVIQNKLNEGENESEWVAIKKAITDALNQCDGFRKDEGKVLEQKMKDYCDAIAKALQQVIALDAGRVEKVRQKLKGNVISFFGEQGYDVNRLEQEIIYYIEKFDIHEERVRLQAHLDYFLQALHESQSNGKKLGFIAQEIGREINTIGSKANDATMQKHVVAMKEELEKIKEQLGNVL